MLTKMGEGLVKRAIFLGGLVGAARANSLTPREKFTLADEYNLPDYSTMIPENTIRGAVGDALGGVAGASLGASLAKYLGSRNPLVYGLGGGLVGAGLGAWMGTNKYSKGMAAKAEERQRKFIYPKIWEALSKANPNNVHSGRIFVSVKRRTAD